MVRLTMPGRMIWVPFTSWLAPMGHGLNPWSTASRAEATVTVLSARWLPTRKAICMGQPAMVAPQTAGAEPFSSLPEGAATLGPKALFIVSPAFQRPHLLITEWFPTERETSSAQLYTVEPETTARSIGSHHKRENTSVTKTLQPSGRSVLLSEVQSSRTRFHRNWL